MTNQWHERFLADEYMYGKEPNAFVTQIVDQLPEGGEILCIAEGEGRNAVYLAKQGFSVTAWDYAQSGLDKTKALAKEQGVHVETALHDLENVEWEAEQWDAIVHIFGHVPEPILERTFQGVDKALKVGGYYVSELYTKEQLQYGTGGPPVESMLIDPKTILDTFLTYFTEHFYVGEVTRYEGVLHTGRAHVVQSLLKKRS